MEYINGNARDTFKTKATEEGRPKEYINIYALLYRFPLNGDKYRCEYDYDKREEFFDRLEDFVKHFEGEGFAGRGKELMNWDFYSKLPFYDTGDIEVISVMAPEDNIFVRRFLEELNPEDYAVEYKKMAPRKITKQPKDTYGTPIDIGDVVVFEGRAHKVTKIISDKTVNRPRMFGMDCVLIKAADPNKKLGWEEHIK